MRPTNMVNLQPRLTFCARGLDALAVTLARLAYPCRLISLCEQLHLSWSEGKLSSIIAACINHIDTKFGDRVLYDTRVFTDHQRLAIFSAAIKNAGAPFDSCPMFIDGTLVQICRPGHWLQGAYYSGHKRKHCLRFQGILTPDGMLASFYGPYPGASTDLSILTLSAIDDRLWNDFGVDPVNTAVSRYFIYSDLGYNSNSLKTIYTAADFQGQPHV